MHANHCRACTQRDLPRARLSAGVHIPRRYAVHCIRVGLAKSLRPRKRRLARRASVETPFIGPFFLIRCGHLCVIRWHAIIPNLFGSATSTLRVPFTMQMHNHGVNINIFYNACWHADVCACYADDALHGFIGAARLFVREQLLPGWTDELYRLRSHRWNGGLGVRSNAIAPGFISRKVLEDGR